MLWGRRDRARRKRMEVERPADKRHRAPERPAEQVMMTRRTFLFKGLAASSFAVLTGRLWWLQVHTYEEHLAAAGEITYRRRFHLPAARGMIYERGGHLLAENLKSWAVAVLPASLPKGQPEREALFAALGKHLSLGDIATVVPKQLPQAAAEREDVYARLAAVLGLPVDDVREPVEYERGRAASNKKYELPSAIKVSRELPPERAAAVRALARDLPDACVAVVSPIQHLVATKGIGDPYQPLVIKKGITKEMALGIEANRVYLPGVQIDDEGLSRRYSIGEELGHILGYTGPISEERFLATVERDERGQPLRYENGDYKSSYRPSDHVGQAGIEGALEDILRGRPGHYIAQMNVEGQIEAEYTQLRKEPVDGHSVTLTVGLDYQRDVIAILEAGIRDGIEENKEFNEDARRQGQRQRPLQPGTGAAVALDPRTGEILAMVSLPGYDPRPFAEGISQQKLDEYLEVGVPEGQQRFPLMNRCMANAFPAGSTIKTFMAAAGLQDGRITPETKTKCAGEIQVPWTWNELIRDKYFCYTRDASHGDQDVKKAIATSCDVFFYVLSVGKVIDERGLEVRYYRPDSPDPTPFDGLGIIKIKQHFNAFGFGNKTGIELAGEDPGVVPDPDWKADTFGPEDGWSVGDTINTSIGQGFLLVTPLQMCNATAAIANRGTVHRPTVVREVRDAAGDPVPLSRESRRLPIDRRHLEVVREGMLMSTTDPDGLVSRAPRDGKPDKFPLPEGVTAGVKTGTAEYGNEGEKDELGRFLRAHAWCTAFAPYENPEICVVAFIEGGFGSATVAAPVASAMIRSYYDRKQAGAFGG